MNYKKEIIAVLDPMCSWCWGFEPVLRRVQAELPRDTRLSILLGGLRSKGEQEWTSEFRHYLQGHWKHVEAKTGQRFMTDLLDKKEFEYDTEPACRALVTLRELDASKVLSFFHALQAAFYLRSKDITQTDIIMSIAEEEGIDKAGFKALFLSQEMKDKTKEDSYKARSMGANSFPSLVFIDEEGHLSVLKGYRSFEQIKKSIQLGWRSPA